MQKSSKRIKLENEIFSKSIKDIEKMFSCSVVESEERFHKRPSTSASAVLNNTRSDIFSDHVLKKTAFEYDCVNLSLMESLSEPDDGAPEEADVCYSKVQTLQVPTLPSSTLIPGQITATAPSPGHIPLDLRDDYEYFDAKHAAGFVESSFHIPHYKNLERDLRMIDQMLSRPFHRVHVVK
ncbi:hypothetical protein CJJ07_004974 [Candidozyma auris]|nr:hypothetical protein CJJ07_004974 [[Candida] auris]